MKTNNILKAMWNVFDNVLPYRPLVGKILMIMLTSWATFDGAYYILTCLLGSPNRATPFLWLDGIRPMPVLPFTTIWVVWYIFILMISAATVLWGLTHSRDNEDNIRPNGIFAFWAGYFTICVVLLFGQIG